MCELAHAEGCAHVQLATHVVFTLALVQDSVIMYCHSIDLPIALVGTHSLMLFLNAAFEDIMSITLCGTQPSWVRFSA